MWTSVFLSRIWKLTKSGNGFTTTRVNTMISSFAGDSFRIWKRLKNSGIFVAGGRMKKDEELY